MANQKAKMSWMNRRMLEFYSFVARSVQRVTRFGQPPSTLSIVNTKWVASRFVIWHLRKFATALADHGRNFEEAAMQLVDWKHHFKLRSEHGFHSALIAALSGALTIYLGACSSQRTPMEVSVTQLAPYMNAAKDPGCKIPILNSMPTGTYTQVAIVEAWADLKDTEDDVLPALRRKACETGADALVILNSTHQDIKQLLYQASPNEQHTETTQQNVYAGQGDYIQEMEHTRGVGEAGHNGLYIDAIAIMYPKTEGKGAAAETASPNELVHPKGS
jgi:hypothetical protein